jgi:hypothetical protein
LRAAAEAERSRLIQKILEDDLAEPDMPDGPADDVDDSGRSVHRGFISDLYSSSSHQSHAKGARDE